MAYRGFDLYDQASFFNKYMERRNGIENANDTLEKPIICEMISKEARCILDLGCGNAAWGHELIASGAHSYTGLEGSRRMVELARRNLCSPKMEIVHTPLETWNYPADRYDLAVSRLVIHYIEDILSLFSSIYRTLKKDGTFVFSVEHPVMTSSYGLSRAEGIKQDWIVDNYFVTGEREQEWLGSKVTKYHRTLEDYFAALQKAGFTVEQIRESRPDKQNFLKEETFHRRMRIPLFLFMRGKKI
ncbi:class I SAM-dependent methyltransferase [Paenibacillus sp. J2TS4]|uniref:class I SAM-dependent DNA methyltransferase n=1 Tax=Paenibacillus sp. J2TS4 TaxID=2807194 RepID=UPI001B141B2E|nr:methyltransferase domain-containing protein [Paenibacillus sp. J2TS4]GIP34850.1 methyltransferase [Paenibacillus sp. J2TS4]